MVAILTGRFARIILKLKQNRQKEKKGKRERKKDREHEIHEYTVKYLNSEVHFKN